MSSGESDDDSLQLSAQTMGALLEFYKEQEERADKLRQIEEGDIPEFFEENWNMSQFWYSEETAKSLAEECLRAAGNHGSIACVSSPTLYRMLKKMDHNCSIKLLEYDTRFAVFKDDFILYDFKDPLGIPRELFENFDVIVADPPYLSEDCFTKTAATVKYLMKPNAKIIVCTGSVMEELAGRLLGVTKCRFKIEHVNSLSNPFLCYANYNLDHYKS
ncbi:hypothetical protein OTU49_011175 [Cherax quadricarinatus]|uniref:Protein-lysine N-methyltransferase OTU49_011175 n=1 Tax=Cherax quadricarinatus TaxID=27406 RepID=A0AAW0W5S4_CHEQU|nr:EEF1A lysine methyltransferase 1-like [Cherax quadricarinatus]XP_053653770.1 EEF1A lysine methyltransferase 1-like [Cherax quadricarinatus]